MREKAKTLKVQKVQANRYPNIRVQSPFAVQAIRRISISRETMINKNSLLAGVVIPDARKYSTTSSWPCSDYELGFSRVLGKRRNARDPSEYSGVPKSCRSRTDGYPRGAV